MAAYPIELHEGAARELSLTPGRRAALDTCGYVTVSGGRSGRWQLRDRKKVGTARIGTGADAVELTVRPKLPIARLMFLVGYARHRPKLWFDEDVGAGTYPDLLPAVAHMFARAATRTLRRGVLEGYREVERTAHEIRGRIRATDQVNRHYGLTLPVEVRYDERTPDIAENRVLLAATRHLLDIPGLGWGTPKLLDEVADRLWDVTPPSPLRPLPAWRRSRLNARYHQALDLADLVLRDGSYEMAGGRRLRVDGLMLDMWVIYQDFAMRALQRSLERYGGVCTLEKGNTLWLDHGSRVEMHTDLVYRDRHGDPVAVADAKYAAKKGTDNEYVYQMLAYCTALGIKQAHLVYARGEAVAAEHRIRGGQGITIYQHALDLDQPPAALLAQVDAIATKIVTG